MRFAMPRRGTLVFDVLTVIASAMIGGSAGAADTSDLRSRAEVILDGKVVLEPRILSPNTGGVVMIAGNQSRDDVERLEYERAAPRAAILLREVG